MDLSMFGVTSEQLQKRNDYPLPTNGRVLILDGDSDCYAASANSAKLDTAVRKLRTAIYEKMFLTNAEFVNVHLTPKGCMKNGRHLLLGAQPYQGKRSGKAKPPLLEVLRSAAEEAFADDKAISCFAHYDIEADDAIMREAYTTRNCVVYSEDKDLNIVPCPLYKKRTGKIDKLCKGDVYGWIDEAYTPAGDFKVDGHGTKFFWWQMLAGDTADDVKGILKYNGKNCGKVVAYKTIHCIDTEEEAANLVIDGYRKINQNPIPEGEALWLSRCKGDSFYNKVLTCGLSNDNLEYIQECYHRDWRMTQDEYDSLKGTHD